MRNFSNRQIEKVLRALGGLRADVALIGSGSEKDLDLLVISQEAEKGNYSNTVPFVGRLPRLQNELGCEIIVKHEHLNLVQPRNKPVCHLLFYPTYEHLRIWELPAFLSCVYERGHFCIGNRLKLATYYKEYRSERLDFTFDVLRFHIISYVDLAITNLIYLTVGSNIFSKKGYLENLIYVYRYSLREFLVSELGKDAEITVWEWNEILEHVEQRSDLKSLARLFRLKGKGTESICQDDLRLLFLEYLKFCDLGISGVAELRIDEILNNAERK